MFHERSHIYMLRDEVNKEVVKMEKVSTEENATDMLAKALPTAKFRHCLELVGLDAL